MTKTAVMSRRIKFIFIYAGLTAATLFVLWMTARFIMSLSPEPKGTAVSAIQPTAVMEGTAVSPTPLPTVSPMHTAQPVPSVTHKSFDLPPEPTATAVPPTPFPSPSPSPSPPPPPQLIIPSLEVSRTIKTVYVVDGQWDISVVKSDIGWLQTTGEHPNDDQGMTFVGHVTRPWPEIAGPLADLMFMEMGDEIIYRYAGTDFVYALERYLKVDPQSVKSLYVDDGAVLSLTTCSNWNFADFQYDKRLIAQARLVRTEPSQVGGE